MARKVKVHKVETKSVVPEIAKRLEAVWNESGRTWQSYFPVRVTLTRQDVLRVVASLMDAESSFKRGGLCADRDLAQIMAILKCNLDSALKFSDQNFILVTQDEYDRLTAKQA
jgi:hypothetical protein